jgi:hypothetical protein
MWVWACTQKTKPIIFKIFLTYRAPKEQAANISSSNEYRMSDKEYSRNQKYRQTEDQGEDAMVAKENLEHTLKKA